MKRIKNFTLGILGATILSLGLYACSNDNETNTTESSNVENTTTTASRPLPPVEDATDQMFYDYITSDLYILKQEKISAFNIRLGSGTDLFFPTRESLLSWIGSHIDLTDFQSVEDAETSWIEVEDLVAQERIEYAEVYGFIENSSIESVVHYLGKWIGGNYTTYASCYEQYRNCTNAAGSAFKETANDIKNSANSDKNNHYACAQRELKIATDACNAALDKCRNSQA